MLSALRNRQNSLKWIWWIMIVALGAGMLLLFSGGPPGGGATGFGGSIASVAGDSIPVLEFNNRFRFLQERYRQQFGQQFDQLKPQLRIPEQALNSLISEYSIAHESQRLGFSVPAEELAERIVSYPAFQDAATKTFVGYTRYEEILRYNDQTPAMFETTLRREILRDKLLSLLTEGIEPSETEMRRQYAKQHQQSKVSYVYFEKENVTADDVEVSDEQLTSFFEENGDNYRIPERRKATYLQVPISASKVQVTDAQVQSRIEAIPAVDRVRASHILFRVPPGGDDALARERGQEVLAKIKAGADFAEMARQHSDDSNAEEGGDLGFKGRGEWVPEFENVAFSLEAGQVSDLVKTPFGIHIIKVTAAPKTSDESRRMLAEFQVREEEAGRLAQQLATTLLQRWKDGEDVSTLLATDESIRRNETNFFSLSENVVGLDAGVRQRLFTLKKGEWIDPVPTRTAVIIARLDDIEASRLPALEDVRDQVISDYREQKKDDLFKQQAADVFQAAKEAGSLEAVAKERDLPLIVTDFFKDGDTVDDILQFSPLLHERVLDMQVGDVSPAITVREKLIVFQLEEITPFDEEGFEQEKEALAENLRTQKRNGFFGAYVQNVVDQLRKEEKINIDRELLDSLSANL